MEADESMYHATPQKQGRASHESVDRKSASTKKADILSLPIISERLCIIGKIDMYRADTKTLIERKYQLKQIFRGQLYQLWAEYFCMIEMGYEVEHLAFYEISTNKTIRVELPNEDNYNELSMFLLKYRNYDPETSVTTINSNKCIHCIYCNLCDKTDTENVY